MVLMAWVVAGPEALRATLRWVEAAARGIGFGGLDGLTILGVLTTFSAGIGATVGAASWVLAGRVRRRLGRGP
jgi:hypothetical protein